MFSLIDNFDLNDIFLILIDDAGEKVYSANCIDEYELMMVSGHISNMLKRLNIKYIFSEINFENMYIKVYPIDEFLLFFIRNRSFDSKSNKLIKQVKEKITDIIEE